MPGANENTLDIFGWKGGPGERPGTGTDPNTTTIEFPWYVPGFEVPAELRDLQPSGPNPGGPIRQYNTPSVMPPTLSQWIDANTSLLLLGGGLLAVVMIAGGRRR